MEDPNFYRRFLFSNHCRYNIHVCCNTLPSLFSCPEQHNRWPWHSLTILTIIDDFDNIWQLLTIFSTIFDNIWYFLTIFTIVTNFTILSIFHNFHNMYNFETFDIFWHFNDNYEWNCAAFAILAPFLSFDKK